MVRLQDQTKIKTCETLVTFKKLSDDEIKSYVYSNEGKGKAGDMAFMGQLANLYQESKAAIRMS